MLGSDTLEVGIGMALLFLFMSLIATAVREAVENLSKARAQDLFSGITELLQDRSEGEELIRNFYTHPMIASLYGGQYDPTNKKQLPSYIPRENFAIAVLDLASGLNANKHALSFDSLRVALESEPAPNNLQRVVLLALKNAEGSYVGTRKAIEDWYDGTMDRVSGWYVRRTGRWLFGIGLVSAIFFNVDAITIAQRLASDDELRQAVVRLAERPPAAAPAAGGEAGTTADLSLRELTGAFEAIGYPIGWAQDENHIPYPKPQSCSAQKKGGAAPGAAASDPAAPTCQATIATWITAASGWMITAFAIMLGAPFWFDILNKFMAVRSTIKPKEKSPDEPPIDGISRKPATASPGGGTVFLETPHPSSAAEQPDLALAMSAAALATQNNVFEAHEWAGTDDPQKGVL